MAEVKFSELPLASPLVGDEIVTGLKPSGSSSDDENVNFSIDDIAAYVFSQDSGGAASGDVVGPASATNNALSLFDGTTGKLLKDSLVTISTDGTFATNSDSKVPTEKAVKTYVATSVTGLLDFKGSTDTSANPNYPAASKGDAYVVSVAGKIGGGSGKSVDVGDVYLATADNAGGTEASVGTSWIVLEHNLQGAVLAGAITGSGLTMATARLLGRITASTGAVEEISVGSGLSLSAGSLTATGSGGTVTSVDASGGVQTASGSAITGTGTVRGAHVINAQTGTSYALIATDRGKHVTQSNASSSAYTIAQAGTTGFEDGWFTFLENIGVGALTLTPTTSTINGAATLVLDSGMSAIIFSDGTNYRAIVVERAGVAVNAQTGTSYTYLSGDRGKLVTHTNASAIAGTLPQATTAFGSSWFMWVENRGAGTLTITPTTSTIDGAASLALTTNQGCLIASDGTNYFTMRGVGGTSGGSTKYRKVFKPRDNEPPTSNFATLDTRNNHPVLDFDTTTQEAAIFSDMISAAYGGGDITVAVTAALTSATTGTLGWDVTFERVGTAQDIDSDGFATAQTITAATVPGTSGFLITLSVSITAGSSGTDSLAAGEGYRLRIRRDVANDTAAGDAELWAVVVSEN